jgi:hypothetical protein
MASWSVLAVLGLGLVVLFSASGNEVNLHQYTPIGKKVFRSGLGFGIVSGALLMAVLNHL